MVGKIIILSKIRGQSFSNYTTATKGENSWKKGLNVRVAWNLSHQPIGKD